MCVRHGGRERQTMRTCSCSERIFIQNLIINQKSAIELIVREESAQQNKRPFFLIETRNF